MDTTFDPLDKIFDPQRPLKRHLDALLDRLEKEVSQLPEDTLDKKNDDEICSEHVQKLRLVAPEISSPEDVEPSVDESVANGPRKGIQYHVAYKIPVTQGEPSLVLYRPDDCQDVNGILTDNEIVCVWPGGDAKAIRKEYLRSCELIRLNLQSMGKQIAQYNAAAKDGCSGALRTRRERLDRKRQFKDDLTRP